MPLYEYACESCEHQWAEQRQIASRDVAVNNPCPECGVSGQVTRHIGTAPLLYSVNYSVKTDDSFNDRLKDIKRLKGRTSTIETR